jgi:integrase
MAMTCLTSTTLIEVMRERAGQAGLPTQASLPNYETALRHFAEERGLKLDDPIGGLLRLGYPKALAAHTAALSARKVDLRVIANRRSALKAWRKLVNALDRESAAIAGSKPPFAAALRRLIEECRTPDGAQISIRRIAIQAGVPIATLRRWIAGVHPKGRHVGMYTKRLERFFGLAPGAIQDTLDGELLPDRKETDAPRNEYRLRLARMNKDAYLFKPSEATAAFREEWSAFVQMKTQLFSGADAWSAAPVEAGVRKIWVLHGPNSARGAADDWVDSKNNRLCPTAGRAFQYVSGYIGWLARPTESGGAGMDIATCQSLCFFTDVPRLSQYLEWRIARADGVLSGAIMTILQFTAMLIHPNTGYLRRNPALGKKMGITSEEAWARQCDVALQWVRNSKRAIAPKMRMSRDSFEPIHSILELKNPMGAVADAVQRMRAARVVTGGEAEAKWGRDLLLLMLLASNPIRARNVKELTWRADNSGSLRQDADGGWRIVIARHRLKNANGAARDADYNCRVQPAVWPHLERYLREYRPLLSSAGTDYVFVCPSGKNRPWRGLNRRFMAITRRFFVGTEGFGPHAMRHIVATAILKLSGSIIRAAKALHDRPETVQKHYGFFLNDDVAEWMTDAFSSEFNRF